MWCNVTIRGDVNYVRTELDAGWYHGFTKDFVLSVLGQGVGAGANGRVALGDWGYAITLEQGTEATTDGFRGFVWHEGTFTE